MSYTINSGVGQWDKNADLEWRLNQMQQDMKFMWNRLADLEAARDAKVDPNQQAGIHESRAYSMVANSFEGGGPSDVKDYIRATKPDAGEPTHKYFEACLQENAKLIEENNVLKYQYKTMHEETVRCKEQIEKQRNSAECQGSTIQSLYEQRDELLIENKKLKENLTKKYEGEKAAAPSIEESSTYWQQKYNEQLQTTDILYKELDFFEKMAHDLELEKNDAKWYREQAIKKCIDIVEQIKNDPLTAGDGKRWMVAICEDIQRAIKNEFGVK